MEHVTVRELRNQGGRVLDRVEQGEELVVTRDGREVAALRPIPKALPASLLVERYRRLPELDPDELRRELDEIIEPAI